MTQQGTHLYTHLGGSTRSDSDTERSHSAVIHTWMVSNNVNTVCEPVQGLIFKMAIF
jgi:hypothetical protein